MTRFLPAAFALVCLLTQACGPKAGGGLTDDLGRDVGITREPNRVVTLAPNVTELVAFVGAADRIVAVDDFSDHPAVEAATRVGGMEPNVELIAELRPDLVIASASGNHPELAPMLARLSIPLYVVRTERIGDLAPAAARLAALFGSSAPGRYRSAIDEVIAQQKRVRKARPRILFVVWPDPLYVAGHATFLHDLIELTGGANAVPPAVDGWRQLSPEVLLTSPPDIVLYAGSDGAGSGMKALDDLFSRLPASARPHYHAVDDDLFTRPGPRLGEAAGRLNAIIDGWERSR